MSSNSGFNLLNLDPKTAVANASAIALMAMMKSGVAARQFMNSQLNTLIGMSSSLLDIARWGGVLGIFGELMNTVGTGLSYGTNLESIANDVAKRDALDAIKTNYDGKKAAVNMTRKGAEKDLGILGGGKAEAGDKVEKLANEFEGPAINDDREALLAMHKGSLVDTEDLARSQAGEEKKTESIFGDKEKKLNGMSQLYQAAGRLSQSSMNMMAQVNNGRQQTVTNLLQLTQSTFRDLISYINALSGMNFYSQLGR